MRIVFMYRGGAMNSRITRILALLGLAAIAVAGCGDAGADSTGGPRVVATTTQVADLVRAVGGNRIALTRLLPANADPHEHELRPSEVAALNDADVVVRSGGEVDQWAVDRGGPEALSLLDHVQRRGDDPHWWQDPRNAVLAVGAIRDALTEADPDGKAAYAAAARREIDHIRATDAAIERCWANVPRAQRTLVTTHDAYGYYAARYGLRVLGAVIPSLSSHAQASAGQIDALVRQIRRLKVKAIFSEAALNEDLEHAVAEEGGASSGHPLWGDTLGPAGSSGATYLGALAADTHSMVDGLSGRTVACDIPT
jgi:ABC-type Zn uptake system ZnuABC Zn-binding protein ZnuA